MLPDDKNLSKKYIQFDSYNVLTLKYSIQKD